MKRQIDSVKGESNQEGELIKNKFWEVRAMNAVKSELVTGRDRAGSDQYPTNPSNPFIYLLFINNLH